MEDGIFSRGSAPLIPENHKHPEMPIKPESDFLTLGIMALTETP